MPRKLTFIQDKGEVEVFADTVVVAVYHAKKVYLHCTNGVESYMWCKLDELKAWFDRNKIQYFPIDRNKFACKPHVIGFMPDDSLIFNPRFFASLTKEEKQSFRIYSIAESYKTEWRRISGNENGAAGNENPSAGNP